MQMMGGSYKRGILRIWIVCAAFWCVGAIIVRRSAVSTALQLYSTACDLTPPAEVAKNRILTDGDMGLCDSLITELASTLLFIVGPPIGLLVLGYAAAWVIAGFRDEAIAKD